MDQIAYVRVLQPFLGSGASQFLVQISINICLLISWTLEITVFCNVTLFILVDIYWHVVEEPAASIFRVEVNMF
jgi:hypothetical protein